MKTADGGTVFPELRRDAEAHWDLAREMTLRDWFAGMAIAGMQLTSNSSAGPANQAAVQRAYALADAMLEERKKEK